MMLWVKKKPGGLLDELLEQGEAGVKAKEGGNEGHEE